MIIHELVDSTLTKITQGSTTLRTYSHFVDGQINTAINPHATISRSYDSAGRLIGETQSFTSGPSGGFSYDYDPDGNLEFHTRPDNTVVDYKYDLRNLLKKINTPVNATVAEYTYNGRNQPLQTKVENGLFIATRAYDHAGRLLSVTNGTLDSTSYDLTPDGRRETITRNSDNETYNYDNARQVSTANYGGLSTIQNWTYDEAGNRITAVNNGVTTNYGTAANAVDVNEYTSITGGGFLTPNPSYDPNGNTLHLPRPDGTALTLGWNVHNELTSASNGAGDTATYQYDAFGRRTRRTETIGGVTTTTWFFTNGWNVELEHNGTAPTQRMTWGLDLSGSLQGAGGVGGLIMIEDLTGSSVLAYFPTYDGNGNITAWVDGTGTVVARQRYDAFGNIIQQTGTAPSNYGFSTKPIEKVTGLLYYGYRYYDPITGRWPSRDPIEENGGINLYGMVENSPIDSSDFLGLATYFAIYYDNPGKDPDGSFKKAAETWKKNIESASGFDPVCDVVILKGVKTENNFVTAWNEIKKEAEARKATLPNDYKIAEGSVFVHGTPGNLEFVPDTGTSGTDGSLVPGEQKTLGGLPWDDLGFLTLNVCNSGTGTCSTARNFADAQGVITRGEGGYAYFSESDTEYIEINSSSKDVYLRGFRRRGTLPSDPGFNDPINRPIERPTPPTSP